VRNLTDLLILKTLCIMENFENYGIVSLDNKEMKETDGGGFLLGVLVGGLIYDIISNPSDCIDGFKDGFNS